MSISSISRTVTKKVLAVETPEVSYIIEYRYIVLTSDKQGAGALVRRSIGSMTLRNLSPFLMLDHFHVAQGAVSDFSNVCVLTNLLQGLSGPPS